MKKLRLDVNDVLVESFSVSREEAAQGTVQAHSGGVFLETCYGSCTCLDNMCSADCTGLGVECYTGDGGFHACSAAPCTGAAACTHGTCQTYWPEEETC